MNTEQTRDFTIRRLFLPREVDRLKYMQSTAKEFTDHYPRHREWLDMAVDEVMSGTRVAYGVFKVGFSSDREVDLSLVGSILIKMRHYAGVAELKNLFIMPAVRRRGYGNALYAEVEQYCRKRGFPLSRPRFPALKRTPFLF